MARTHAPEKLWRYTTLVKVWSFALIGVGLLMLPLSVIAQLGEGVTLKYLGTLLGITGITGILFYPLLTMWLKKSRPSEYLDRATKLSGPRLLLAAPRDWRRWSIMVSVFLTIGTVAMMSFLVAVLKSAGPDGIAEGVVIGVLAAWGLVTLEDVRRIKRAEAAAGRTYFAAGERPTAAGNNLRWTVADRPAAPAAAPS